MVFEKENLLQEGKTKKIWSVAGFSYLVIVEHKNTITKFDDSSQTQQFFDKAECSTLTTANVFKYLKKYGVHTAFLKQLSSTEFLALKCEMIPLEVVYRQYATGSYVLRDPSDKRDLGEELLEIYNEAEFFLKTSGGKLEINGQVIVDGLTHIVDGEIKALDDPLIIEPRDIGGIEWRLYNPKIPYWEPGYNLNKTVNLRIFFSDKVYSAMSYMNAQAYRVSSLLKAAWSYLGMRLIDVKMEFGVDNKGNLIISDVIDNDSWRLRSLDWQEEFSKEAFRRGERLSAVAEKYRKVKDMSSRLYLPSNKRHLALPKFKSFNLRKNK